MQLLKYLVNETDDSKSIYKYVKKKEILNALLNLGVKTLRPIQIEAINNGLFFGKNFLICTPSGSGKTLIGEMAIINNFFSNYGKGIYLVPYKALAAEKYRSFLDNYKYFKINIVLSIGDTEIKEKELLNADIIITTFEKLDSILRNKEISSNNWINQIATIVIDEVHVMGDPWRGYKLESLIIRLFINSINIQLICLSATILGPEIFNGWLNFLSTKFCRNSCKLIKSDNRPVELKYNIEIAHNKDSFIRKRVKECIKEYGQILIFLSSRKGTIKQAQKIQNITKKALNEDSINIIQNSIENLRKISGHSKELLILLENGIAFHNAGLLSQERTTIEFLYKKKHIKAICCTTTLAAGVNTPARLVILRDFKKRTINKDISDEIESGIFSEEVYEIPGQDFSYFIPFSNNQTFQLLGRAGRPGLDLIGEGIILTKNNAEYEWVKDHYFKDTSSNKWTPKYNPINSNFSNIGALREQVLLLIFENPGISSINLAKFFENTYFNFNFKKKLPLDRYLLIKNLDCQTLSQLHFKDDLNKYIDRIKGYKISKLTPEFVSIYVQINKLLCFDFDIEKGISCSCGFKTSNEKLKTRNNIRNDYKFCDHLIAFIGYLLDLKLKNDIKAKSVIEYLDKLLPQALKAERIVDFLEFHGFIIRENLPDSIEKFFSTAFGELCIQLYLNPIDMIYIRNLLNDTNNIVENQRDLIDLVCKYLELIGKYRNDYFSEALKMWIEEETLEEIISINPKLTAGDFYDFRDYFCRVLGHFKAVSRFLGSYDVPELAETLEMRVENGIREDIFDIVVRIKGIGRVYGRKLYQIGARTVKDIAKMDPRAIHELTKISPKRCNKIHEEALKIMRNLFKNHISS